MGVSKSKNKNGARFCTNIIAWIQTIFNVFGIFGCVTVLFLNGLHFGSSPVMTSNDIEDIIIRWASSLSDQNPFKHVLELMAMALTGSSLHFVIGILLVASIFGAVFGVVLLQGVRKSNVRYLNCWIMYMIVWTLVEMSLAWRILVVITVYPTVMALLALNGVYIWIVDLFIDDIEESGKRSPKLFQSKSSVVDLPPSYESVVI